jgi:hypothetical protein
MVQWSSLAERTIGGFNGRNIFYFGSEVCNVT